MKICLLKVNGRRIPRKTLRGMALFRRASLIPQHCTELALIDFHIHESTGAFPQGMGEFEYRRTNGFANGKWALKVTVESVQEDLSAGHVCKHEFTRAVHTRWFWKPALEAHIAKEFFPWRTALTGETK
jgi:hypothetical protein